MMVLNETIPHENVGAGFTPARPFPTDRLDLSDIIVQGLWEPGRPPVATTVCLFIAGLYARITYRQVHSLSPTHLERIRAILR
ncbi:hypothetical protein [Xanthocytophaga agilis]|uniref:Uncharacterized protein n=1 Tax=Xanthocytophaga agilis TaxID=3048010 RepID=A0AAE3R413_9BACT|nr:hypothetical protein [Xanthocytophaga agilis]MDJ1502775.1 hypothetical protein [Xanthocytophaga agilis]